MPAQSGLSVSPELAARWAPFGGGAAIIADSLATTGFHFMKRGPNGARDRANETPEGKLVHSFAGEFVSAASWRRQMARDAIYRGFGCSVVSRTSAGKPIELIRLDPRKVQIEEDEATGEAKFSITPKGDQKRILPRRDVVFVPFQLDGIKPVSAVHLGREAIALGIVLESMAANFVKRGMRPSGTVSVPTGISDKALNNLREIIAAQFSGVHHAGHTPILPNGAEYKSFEIKLTDAQYLQLREHQIVECARVLSLPPMMLQHYGRVTWGNAEAMGLQYLQTCLASWAQKFEEALTVALIPMDQRDKFFIEADFNGLAKVDLSARANAYAQFRSAGILSANECRAMEGRGPVPGGDSYSNPYTDTGSKNQE